MVNWEWDSGSDRVSGSPGREALYGRPPGSLPTLGDVLAAVHPEDRGVAAGTVARAMARPPGEEEFDAVEFRVVYPDGSVRWLRSQGRVTQRDPATGRALRAAGVTFDVTARRVAEIAAARALAELRAVYDTAPVGLALLDREGRLLSLNARLAAMTGVQQAPPPVASDRRLDEVLPAAVLDTVREGHRRVLESGEAAPGTEVGCVSPASPGDRRRWFASLQPVLAEPAEGGGVLAVSLMLEDVTERHRAEARRDLLAREVDHRARNALAVVLATVRMTQADTVPGFVRAVEGRIASVARAQTLLADRHWTGAALRAVVEGALSVFTHGQPDEGARFDGPDVTLNAAAVQPLSMALHELATNAVKYGALSVAGGEVSIRWSLDRLMGLLRLRWAEMGGPALSAPPPRRGFGSRVLEATIRDQLGGRVKRDWSGRGLVCEIALPIARTVA
ncbi:MAG: PAS domain-containing protein, partial [Acetobacteraceae bacterium]|nr:PAS domain-containing protein [Acetobacteraceae bacterium]